MRTVAVVFLMAFSLSLELFGPKRMVLGELVCINGEAFGVPDERVAVLSYDRGHRNSAECHHAPS